MYGHIKQKFEIKFDFQPVNEKEKLHSWEGQQMHLLTLDRK